MSTRVSTWLPVVVWAAVIFTLSSIPHLGTDLGVWDTILRKGAHTLEYTILGALLLRALGREAPAFLAGVAYAVTDEIRVLNKRLDHSEGFARLAHELRNLNDSLQALAYAALGQQGPQVRRRRAG